jgi:hypothetical protein
LPHDQARACDDANRTLHVLLTNLTCGDCGSRSLLRRSKYGNHRSQHDICGASQQAVTISTTGAAGMLLGYEIISLMISSLIRRSLLMQEAHQNGEPGTDTNAAMVSP